MKYGENWENPNWSFRWEWTPNRQTQYHLSTQRTVIRTQRRDGETLRFWKERGTHRQPETENDKIRRKKRADSKGGTLVTGNKWALFCFLSPFTEIERVKMRKGRRESTQRLIKRSPIAVQLYCTGSTMTPNQRENNDATFSRALWNGSKTTNTFPKKHSPYNKSDMIKEGRMNLRNGVINR